MLNDTVNDVPPTATLSDPGSVNGDSPASFTLAANVVDLTRHPGALSCLTIPHSIP